MGKQNKKKTQKRDSHVLLDILIYFKNAMCCARWGAVKLRLTMCNNQVKL